MMSANVSTSRFFTIVAASIIIIAGMRAAQALIVPFILATFLAIILMPIVKWFQRLGFGTAAAVVLIISVTLCSTFWISLYVGNSVKDFSSQIVSLRGRVDKQQMIIMRWVDEHLTFLKPLTQEENGESESPPDGESQSAQSDPMNESDADASVNDSEGSEPFVSEKNEDHPPGDVAENIPPLANEGEIQSNEKADPGEAGAPLDPDIEVSELEKSNEGQTITSDEPAAEGEPSLPDDGNSREATESGNGADSELPQSPAARQSTNQPEVEWLDLNATFEFYLKQLLSGVTLIFSNAMLIVITVIFMLFEAARFPAKLVAAFGATHSAMTDIAQVVNDVRRYMQIKTLTSALTGVLVIALLIITDVPLPLLWGLVAFLLNFVPNIGSIIAAVPPVTLAFFEASEYGFWITAAGYVVINFAVSYGIEPKYMGQGLGLSTLVVFLSLVFWGWVLGPVGMLLSAPLTMIVKIVLQNSEETRWMSILLGAKAPDVKTPT